MANFSSFKSFFDGNAPVYIAPLLLGGSLLHIFDLAPQKHQFGQLEVIGALILVCYYLWQQIGTIYPQEKLGKKRIEAVVCIVIGIFSGLLLFAPLLSWQYIALYSATAATDRPALFKPLMAALLTIWAGIGIFLYSTYTVSIERLNAGATSVPTSSFPTPPTGTQ